MKKNRVIIYGFGQIGRMLYRHFEKVPDIEVVAVVDTTPAQLGRDAGELAGAERPAGFPVRRTAREIDVPADVAVVTTVSRAEAAADQLIELLKLGFPVVTTCEELFYPFRRHAEAAWRIDQTAKAMNLGCVATGINPGYLMDLLPVMLSGATTEIEQLQVERIQDASPRRMQFQKKIGAGLDLAEFARREAEGTLRHVGLPESVDFLGAALGWELAEVTEELTPVIADADLAIPGAIPVKKGQARGVRQIGHGLLADGREVIRLEFVAAIGEADPRDRVVVRGNPVIDSCIRGGVNGDRGTCAVVTSTVKRLLNCRRSGFLTMLELPTAAGAIQIK